MATELTALDAELTITLKLEADGRTFARARLNVISIFVRDEEGTTELTYTGGDAAETEFVTVLAEKLATCEADVPCKGFVDGLV
jgi:hypothetical protein